MVSQKKGMMIMELGQKSMAQRKQTRPPPRVRTAGSVLCRNQWTSVRPTRLSQLSSVGSPWQKRICSG